MEYGKNPHSVNKKFFFKSGAQGMYHNGGENRLDPKKTD